MKLHKDGKTHNTNKKFRKVKISHLFFRTNQHRQLELEFPSMNFIHDFFNIINQ